MLGTLRRTLVPSTWLGWQVESNWTDPFLFLVFSVVKPVAGVLILGMTTMDGASRCCAVSVSMLLRKVSRAKLFGPPGKPCRPTTTG